MRWMALRKARRIARMDAGRKLRRKLGALLYYGLAQHLPPSWTRPSLGQTALRRFCGRLMLAHCGKQVNIEKGAVFSPKVSLGDYSGIGIGARIYGSCHIGDHVIMGANVTIISRNHAFARTDIPMRYQGFEAERPVTIGDDVWIGDRVIILPGVHVGNGCILGAGAVVTKDIPDFSVAVGVPARVVKRRGKESERERRRSEWML